MPLYSSTLLSFWQRKSDICFMPCRAEPIVANELRARAEKNSIRNTGTNEDEERKNKVDRPCHA